MSGEKIGLFVGRFQPLHFGHQSVINEIFHDGRKPAIVISSANRAQDERNPFTYAQRLDMIRAVYGDSVITIHSNDNPDWNAWWQEIEEQVRWKAPDADMVVYYHPKPEDALKERVTFDGLAYQGCHYMEVLENRVRLKRVTFPDRFPVPVCATSIRNAPNHHRPYIDGRVYQLAQAFCETFDRR